MRMIAILCGLALITLAYFDINMADDAMLRGGNLWAVGFVVAAAASAASGIALMIGALDD